MKVRLVYIFPNGMVAAFDEEGDQMPEYQGRIFDALHNMKENCDDATKFYFVNSEEGEMQQFDWGWMFTSVFKQKSEQEEIR